MVAPHFGRLSEANGGHGSLSTFRSNNGLGVASSGEGSHRRSSGRLRLLPACSVLVFCGVLLFPRRSFSSLQRQSLSPGALSVRPRVARAAATTATAVETSLELAPGRYQTMTRIKVRQRPDVTSQPTGEVLAANLVIQVSEVVQPSAPGELAYLKLADRDGWIFDKGIAGNWVSMPIVQRLTDAPASPVDPPAGVVSSDAVFAARAAATEATAPREPGPAIATPPPPAVAPPSTPAATAASTAAEPMVPTVALATAQVHTLRLPANMLGAGYEMVELDFPGGRRLTFVLASGFPMNAVNGRGRELLGDVAPQGEGFTGGWMSQAAKAVNNFNAEKVRFATTNSELGTLHLEVLEFPQALALAQMGIEVHGVLGQPFFAERDYDLDRYGGRASFFAPAQAASQGFYSTVKHLPGLAMPAGGLGIALTGNYVDSTGQYDDGPEATFVGILDTGSPHTFINWEAAKMMGFTGPEDPRLFTATKVVGAGATGKAEQMPVTLARFSICGVPDGVKPMIVGMSKEEYDAAGTGKGWYLSGLEGGPNCVKLGAVNVAIGDVLALSALHDSGVGIFQGAAAIVGQDVLFQAQRLVLNQRDQQVWVEVGDVRDDTPM